MVTAPIIHEPQDARHSTSHVAAAYLGGWGRILGNPLSRSWVHQTVREGLRVARTDAEKRRVMDTWRHVHYLGKGKGGVFYPGTIRLSYYLDLLCLRAEPHPWWPAACVTIRFAALPGRGKGWKTRLAALGLESPMEALEIARSFVADDLRFPNIQDFSPAVLREVVRRMRDGTDWAEAVRGRVQWRPRWLLTYADPTMGHDGGLYRGAGARYLGESAGGKLLFGWPLEAGEGQGAPA